MATLKSKDGTISIATYHHPRASARARVMIVHGFGEHAQRYTEVAEALVAAGFDTLAYDHRGHGNSTGARGYIDSFSQYEDDFETVLAESERLAPGLPAFVVAHSMGALVSLATLVDRPQKLAGIVLSSPFLRVKLQVPIWKVLAGKAASRLYPGLAIPAGLSGKDVTRDPALASLYDSDPLNLKKATARWYTETLLAQDRVFERASAVTLPLLLMHGEADAAADPARSAEIFPRLGSSDKKLELITGAYHEIFNEPPADRKRHIGRVVSWLTEHTPSV
jgi:alpha-beta hydrolase superfamily lysophospholipase